MTIEQPNEGDNVEVTYEADDGEGTVVGEVISRCGVEGDFGIRVESTELAEPVFARTYSPEVYAFDGERRDVLGDLVAIEVVGDE
jgi:hypothetical protein